MTSLLLATWLAAAPGPLEELQRHFDRHGRATPQRDPALERAATALADRALDHPASEISAQASVSAAVSAAGGWDPAPRALVFRARPAAAALQALREDAAAADEPATHAGAASAASGALGTVVVLLAERLAELEPFPRSLPGPVPSQPLCGRLLGELRDPELFVTGPGGAVVRTPARTSNGRFCVGVPLLRPGRHVVEIMARSAARGPEVAALFFSDVAGGAVPAREQALVEPATDKEARDAIHARVNQLRTAHGAGTLPGDPILERVAQRYAERMSAEHFFAHVSPGGDDMRNRLEEAGYAYVSAGENLGSAPGALAAHFGIEHSPGHRRNLLEPTHQALGIGLAWEAVPDGGRRAVVVELLARPTREGGDPTAEAWSALAARRRAAGLPPLERSELLEQMARDHARRMVAVDMPSARLPGGRPLTERVFEATDFHSAAVDVLVADDPAQLAQAAHVLDAAARAAGVGIVRGDSPTRGRGRYWMVLLSAEPRRR